MLAAAAAFGCELSPRPWPRLAAAAPHRSLCARTAAHLDALLAAKYPGSVSGGTAGCGWLQSIALLSRQ
jgi:hypothetical protein